MYKNNSNYVEIMRSFDFLFLTEIWPTFLISHWQVPVFHEKWESLVALGVYACIYNSQATTATTTKNTRTMQGECVLSRAEWSKSLRGLGWDTRRWNHTQVIKRAEWNRDASPLCQSVCQQISTWCRFFVFFCLLIGVSPSALFFFFFFYLCH